MSTTLKGVPSGAQAPYPSKSQEAVRPFEIRIGLVMFGGLSLAVYMGGVVQELLAFVRASQTKSPENPYWGLLQAVNAEVEIDVISGTSAGGLNGIVLAKALATGSDAVSEINRLWREHAQLDKLADTKEPRGLLDNTVLETELHRIFNQMSECGDKELAEQVKVLDLFVTATDLQGRAVPARDMFGQPVKSVRNQHTFRFRLRRRAKDEPGDEADDFEGRTREVAEARNLLLAKVGRATSAFPVAFPIQPITRAECIAADLEHLLPDDGREEVWFSDGGILMNRPFEPVLNTIFNRSAVKPVERVLLWLDPDPEEVARPGEKQGPPHLFDVIAAPVNLPRSEDIGVYLERVAAQNQYRNDVIAAMLRAENTLLPGASQGEMVEAARTNRYYQSHEQLRGSFRTQFGFDEKVQGEMLQELLSWYPRPDEKGMDPEDAWLCHRDTWLRHFDFDFQVRRLHYLLLLLNVSESQALKEDPTQPAEIQRVVSHTQGHLWQALSAWRAARFCVGNLLKVREPEELKEAFKHLHDAGGRSSQLKAAMRQLFEYVQTGVEKAEKLEAMAWDDKAWEGTALPDALRRVRTAALEFEARDLMLFSTLQPGRLMPWDRFHAGRIAPRYTRRIRRAGHDKLASEGLGHFAGFLDPRWRHNDILWGRVDTLQTICQLVIDRATDRGIPKERLAAAVETCMEARLRTILQEEQDIVDQSKLESAYRRAAGAGVPSAGQSLPQQAVPQRERQAAAALQDGDAAYVESERRRKTRESLAAMSDYLTHDHNVGKESLWSPTNISVLFAAGTAALKNLHLVLQQPAEPGKTKIARVVSGILRPVLLVLNFVAMGGRPSLRRLLLPFWGCTLAGLALAAFHALGWVTLKSAGWLLVAALLVPLVLLALFSRVGAFLALMLATTGLLAAAMVAHAFEAPPFPADLLPAGAVTPAVLVAAAVSALALGLMQWLGHLPVTQAAPRPILNLEFAGSVKRLRAITKAWQDEDPRAVDRAALQVRYDFLFIAGYAPLLALLTSLGGKLLVGWWEPLITPAVYLAWAPVVAGLLDMLENIGLLKGLGGIRAELAQPKAGASKAVVPEGWPRLAWGCAAVKFLLLGLAAPVALVGLVAILADLIR